MAVARFERESFVARVYERALDAMRETDTPEAPARLRDAEEDSYSGLETRPLVSRMLPLPIPQVGLRWNTGYVTLQNPHTLEPIGRYPSTTSPAQFVFDRPSRTVAVVHQDGAVAVIALDPLKVIRRLPGDPALSNLFAAVTTFFSGQGGDVSHGEKRRFVGVDDRAVFAARENRDVVVSELASSEVHRFDLSVQAIGFSSDRGRVDVATASGVSRIRIGSARIEHLDDVEALADRTLADSVRRHVAARSTL